MEAARPCFFYFSQGSSLNTKYHAEEIVESHNFDRLRYDGSGVLVCMFGPHLKF